jgi:hypothetical protein
MVPCSLVPEISMNPIAAMTSSVKNHYSMERLPSPPLDFDELLMSINSERVCPPDTQRYNDKLGESKSRGFMKGQFVMPMPYVDIGDDLKVGGSVEWYQLNGGGQINHTQEQDFGHQDLNYVVSSGQYEPIVSLNSLQSFSAATPYMFSESSGWSSSTMAPSQGHSNSYIDDGHSLMVDGFDSELSSIIGVPQVPLSPAESLTSSPTCSSSAMSSPSEAAVRSGHIRGVSSRSPTSPCPGLDFNGRKPRQWTNRKYRCSHCHLSFFDKDLELYAQHVEQVESRKGGILLTRRKYKCTEKSCPWHRIGFFRKLEAQKHFARKHGTPQFECRYWCESGEKYPGCGVCTTRWHADSGNRTRHEQAIHGVGRKP